MVKLTALYKEHNLFIFRDFKTEPKVLTIGHNGYCIVRMGTLRAVDIPYSKNVNKYLIKRNRLFHVLVPFSLSSNFNFVYGIKIEINHEINEVVHYFPCAFKALFLNPFFVSIFGVCRHWWSYAKTK